MVQYFVEKNQKCKSASTFMALALADKSVRNSMSCKKHLKSLQLPDLSQEKCQTASCGQPTCIWPTLSTCLEFSHQKKYIYIYLKKEHPKSLDSNWKLTVVWAGGRQIALVNALNCALRSVQIEVGKKKWSRDANKTRRNKSWPRSVQKIAERVKKNVSVSCEQMRDNISVCGQCGNLRFKLLNTFLFTFEWVCFQWLHFSRTSRLQPGKREMPAATLAFFRLLLAAWTGLITQNRVPLKTKPKGWPQRK